MCPEGIVVSHLSKIPTVSNGWTLWKGGIGVHIFFILSGAGRPN